MERARRLPTTLTDTWGETWTPAAHAAELLDVSVETVRAWADAGRLTGKKMNGFWLFVRLDDVLDLARQRGRTELTVSLPSGTEGLP